MVHSRRHHAFAEEGDLAFRTGPSRRDSDWDAQLRTHDEDLAWVARRAAVSMAAATLRASDGGTGAHSDDVVHLCDAIADELGVHGHDRAELLAAAQLHDIGKVGIPQDVLEKPAPLDESQWALIRRHTVAGQQIVESVPELHEVGRLVRHSHERWDGAGYPDGLSGDQIPLGSRIVFCADAFHAIRSDRPYRRGRTARAALDEVKGNAGSQFDPKVVDALEKSAGQMRTTVRARGKGLTSTLRSRRLMSLLLTLTVGGTALAAGGSFVLPAETDAGAKKAASASGSAPGAGGDKSVPKRESRATASSAKANRRAAAQRAKRSDARAPAAAGITRRRDTQAGSLAGGERPATRAPAAGTERPAATTPVAGTSGRPPAVPGHPPRGRPASPGRSGEAPRRPAQPGQPVGGAPGRSEEAPARPSQPVNLPAKPVSPETGPVKAPSVKPLANAHGR